MKRLFISCLSFFLALKVLLVAHTPSSTQTSPIIEERHEIFTLAVLAYIYDHLESYPKPGIEIAALLAWDVDDIAHTPEFVIDCNRNFERQGNIFHAELMVIEKALIKKQRFNAADSMRGTESWYREVNYRLANTTLYSSLEPCPLCTMAISWSRVPKVIYFMQDPYTRDSETYDPLISFPKEFFFGKQLTQLTTSSLPFAIKENQALREALLQNPPGKYRTILPDGKKTFNFHGYFTDRKKELLKSGYEQFFSYEIQYEQNRELFQNLLQTIGIPGTTR